MNLNETRRPAYIDELLGALNDVRSALRIAAALQPDSTPSPQDLTVLRQHLHKIQDALAEAIPEVMGKIGSFKNSKARSEGLTSPQRRWINETMASQEKRKAVSDAIKASDSPETAIERAKREKRAGEIRAARKRAAESNQSREGSKPETKASSSDTGRFQRPF